MGDAAGVAGDARRAGQRGDGAGGVLAARGLRARPAAPSRPDAGGGGRRGAPALSAGPAAVPGAGGRCIRRGITRRNCPATRCSGCSDFGDAPYGVVVGKAGKQRGALGSQEGGFPPGVHGEGGRDGRAAVDGGWPGVPSAALRRGADRRGEARSGPKPVSARRRPRRSPPRRPRRACPHASGASRRPCRGCRRTAGSGGSARLSPLEPFEAGSRHARGAGRLAGSVPSDTSAGHGAALHSGKTMNEDHEGTGRKRMKRMGWLLCARRAVRGERRRPLKKCRRRLPPRRRRPRPLPALRRRTMWKPSFRRPPAPP